MTSPRERRPKPEPLSAEEEALIEAKYVELYARLQIHDAVVEGRPFSLIVPHSVGLAYD